MAQKDSKDARICIANDAGKLILNAKVYPGLKYDIDKNNLKAVLHILVSEEDQSERPQSGGEVKMRSEV